MRSKTKFIISKTQVDRIFEVAELGKVLDYTALGEGMFNAVYKVYTQTKQYVIKIAPPVSVNVMTYEKDLLRTEVLWYKTMEEKTDIKIPHVYTTDLSCSIIPAQYFIMDYIEGKTINEIKKTQEEKSLLKTSLCKNVAQLHSIKSNKFGYVQNSLYDNWYDALKSFVTNCISDLSAVGKKSKRAEKLLHYVDCYADLLKGVKGCLVNYDIWDLNIVGERKDSGIEVTWIDPERGFYGDPIFDFICIDMMKMSLLEKKESIDLYNSFADEKVEVNNRTEIRFAFALGYMGLIQETEKYYRYKPFNKGWFIDVLGAKMYYYSCFKLLQSN